MGADILALQVLQIAKEGGKTRLAPAATIIQELLKKSPELVQALAKPNWPLQTYVNLSC